MREFNEYWLLKKVYDTVETSNYEDENIVELTSDGIIFVWPKEPDRSELCQYCDICPDLSGDELEEYIALHCQPPEDRMQPCPFVPSDDCDNQDIDDYLADGTWFAQVSPKVEKEGYNPPGTGQSMAPVLGMIGMVLSASGIGICSGARQKRRKA